MNGPLIRDFFKAYRELRYANEGSLRLSEIEHNAYVNRLTIEVTHYDADRSFSLKTNPDSTHWGYCTSFKGSAVQTNMPVKFAKQRVFEQINQGIWNYHQSTESVRVLSAVVQKFGQLALGELASLDDGIGIVGIIVNAVEGLENITADATEWLIEQFVDGDITPNSPAGKYTGYPVSSPFPDVFKFKSDIPASFLFRLESWYLVNPAVYITASPTDTSDETEGEDEYPQPEQGDGDGDSQEFPTSSPNDPNNDPRDGGQKPAAPIEPSTSYTWSGTLSGTLLASSPARPEGYNDPISFTALGNQFPFTAAGDRPTIINILGEEWSGGVSVKDRFGQEVFVYAPGVGFRRGAHTVTVSAQPV